MKQILIFTRINRGEDEFREIYGNRVSPVDKKFEGLQEDIHLCIHRGNDFLRNKPSEIAEGIQSKINENANEVLIVIHFTGGFKELKSELVKLQNGANWHIQQYSATNSSKYKGEIKPAFQQVVDEPSKIETIYKLFSPNYLQEAKLELLHKCLIPENVPSVNKLDSVLSGYSDSFKSFKSKIEAIENNIEEKETKVLTWESEDYIKALTELRISLLGS